MLYNICYIMIADIDCHPASAPRRAAPVSAPRWMPGISVGATLSASAHAALRRSVFVPRIALISPDRRFALCLLPKNGRHKCYYATQAVTWPKMPRAASDCLALTIRGNPAMVGDGCDIRAIPRASYAVGASKPGAQKSTINRRCGQILSTAPRNHTLRHNVLAINVL